MNLRSVEGWYMIFQTLSVIFIFLTVGSGAGTIITGYISHKRQAKSAAEASAKASAEREEMDKLRTSASEAERKRAEVEQALQKLQKQLTPTGITPEQHQRFLYLMERLPKGKVEFRVIADNESSNQLASALADMFAETGCEVERPFETFSSPGKVPFAIGLRIKDEHDIPPHSVSLQKTLERIGIKTPAQVEAPDVPIEPGVVRVYVYGN